MSAQPPSNNPMADFGPNEWLVDELHQQYLRDKNSVDKAWWEFFADYQPAEAGSQRANGNGVPTLPEDAGPKPFTAPAAPLPDPAPLAPAPADKSPREHGRSSQDRPQSTRHPAGQAHRPAERGRRAAAARGRRPHGHQHGSQPDGADRDKRARHRGMDLLRRFGRRG